MSNRNHRFCSLANWQASNISFSFVHYFQINHTFLWKLAQFKKALCPNIHTVYPYSFSYKIFPLHFQETETADSESILMYPLSFHLCLPYCKQHTPPAFSLPLAKHRTQKKIKLIINFLVFPLSISFLFASDNCWSSQCGPCYI